MNSTLQAFRIHNDIPFDWEILRNDAPENLSDADVEVYLINPSGGKTKIDYTLTGNTVHGCSYGKEQYIIGVYRLVLTSTRGTSKNTYDIKAWQLVPHSWMEGGKAPDGLVTKPVHFTSNISTPANGIGIQEISTTSSDADEGVNTVTILLDSGRTYSFDIKNGSKGSTPKITAEKEGLVTTLYTDGVPFATLNDANVTECNEAIARIDKSIEDANSAVTAANKAVEDNTKAVNDKIAELDSAMSKAENVNASYDKETGIITITDREGNIRQIEVGKSSMIVKVALTSEKNGTADKTQNEIANHMLNGGEAYWLIESTGTLCKISSYENFLTGIYTRNHNEFCTLEQRSNRVSFEYHDTNSIKSYNDLKDKPADTRFIYNVAVEVSDILANRATPSAMGCIHAAINNRYVVSVNNYGAQVLLMNCNSAGSSVHFDILSDGNTYHIEISSRYTYTVSRINNVKTIELTFEDGETIPAIVKSGNNSAPSFPYVFDHIGGNFVISHHTFGLYMDEDGNSHFALIFCILHNNVNASIPFIRYVVYLYDESKAAMVLYDRYTEDSAPEWVLDIVSEKSDAGVDLGKYRPGDTVPFAQYYYLTEEGNDQIMSLPLTHTRVLNTDNNTFFLFCISHDIIGNGSQFYAVLKLNENGLEYLSDYDSSEAPAWILKAFNENLASSELDGLMSKTDKTNLDTLNLTAMRFQEKLVTFPATTERYDIATITLKKGEKLCYDFVDGGTKNVSVKFSYEGLETPISIPASSTNYIIENTTNGDLAVEVYQQGSGNSRVVTALLSWGIEADIKSKLDKKIFDAWHEDFAGEKTEVYKSQSISGGRYLLLTCTLKRGQSLEYVPTGAKGYITVESSLGNKEYDASKSFTYLNNNSYSDVEVNVYLDSHGVNSYVTGRFSYGYLSSLIAVGDKAGKDELRTVWSNVLSLLGENSSGAVTISGSETKYKDIVLAPNTSVEIEATAPEYSGSIGALMLYPENRSGAPVSANSIPGKISYTNESNEYKTLSLYTVGMAGAVATINIKCGLLHELASKEELATAVEGLKSTIDKLTGTTDTTQIIDTFNEIIAFLDTFKNDKNLASVLSTLKSEIQTWVEQKQYATKEEVSQLDSKVGELETGKQDKLTEEQMKNINADHTKFAEKTELNKVEKNVNDLNELNYVYGVVIDETLSSPTLQRVGNLELHKSLPVQSLMKRCLLLDDGTVNYYLDANNSLLKEDGTEANLDGTDGMVMVEMPRHYRRLKMLSESSYRVDISLYPFNGAIEIPQMYVSAWEATVDRIDGNMLSSVVNTDVRYRGGDNQSAWDDTYRSVLGKPATAISLTNYRNYARKRGDGWNCYEYRAHLAIFWMYTIEYATLHSQKSYNAELTEEGYKQGGMGDGVANINSTKWNAYNSSYPVIPCGYTASLGNNTGVVPFSFNEEQQAAYDGTWNTNVPSYRGIENPFGHLFKWTDGVMYDIHADSDSGESFACKPTDTSEYGDTSKQIPFGNIPRANGYSKKMILTPYGEIILRENGGSSTTYFCDYCYTSLPAAGNSWRGLLLGGSAFSGSCAGLACSRSNYAASNSAAYIGSRLCFCRTSKL